MKKEMEFIKSLLNNNSLLKWVKKFSADGLQEKPNGKNFSVKTSDDSICVADSSLTKMFFSSASFEGKIHVSFDLKQIREVLSLAEEKGRLIISGDNDKRLAYVQTENNVIVIAPMTEEELAEKDEEEDEEEEEEEEKKEKK